MPVTRLACARGVTPFPKDGRALGSYGTPSEFPVKTSPAHRAAKEP
ncbi:MAG: hypothetical protein K1X51_11595 [Rhodospirillaceae bacterium]|nr:hypothetical protein [Rhodospirillaceae bacterium]